jgi:hypothetical protein
MGVVLRDKSESKKKRSDDDSLRQKMAKTEASNQDEEALSAKVYAVGWAAGLPYCSNTVEVFHGKLKAKLPEGTKIFGWKVVPDPDGKRCAFGYVALALFPRGVKSFNPGRFFALDKEDDDSAVVIYEVGRRVPSSQWWGPQWNNEKFLHWFKDAVQGEDYKDYLHSSQELVEYFQEGLLLSYGEEVETFGEKISM